MEHVISDRLLGRIDEMLGHPTTDPHGDPIPDTDGNLPAQQARPLSEVAPGNYRIMRVAHAETELLDWLRETNLLPGTQFELVAHHRAVGTIELRLETSAESVSLGAIAAVQILVESV